MSDITKINFELKRVNLQLDQLRSQHAATTEKLRKLASDMEVLRAKNGSVEAGNMSKEPELPKPVDPPVPE